MNEYEVFPCLSTPPTDDNDKTCRTTGHDEGAPGYEYECGDTKNNDCDRIGSDCQEANCQGTEYCLTACDKDGDGVQNPSCGGTDCDEHSSRKTEIPVRDANGSLTQESNVFDCFDRRDNDCDGKIDFYGANGYPPDDSCPPVPTPTPTPDTGGGSGGTGGGSGGGTYYSNYYTEQCDDVYLVTTYYSCFPEEPCTYLYETREYKGSVCYTYLD